MIKAILAMPNDSRPKTILVAVLLCLVCSVAVSAAAVLLKPVQLANQELDKKRNIIQIAGLAEQGKTIDEIFARIETRVVNLDTGEYAETIDPSTFDTRAAAADPATSRALSRQEDIASIRRRPNYAAVYLVNNDAGELDRIILPISGYGLWSTLHGFLALEKNANTVIGLGFYEHAETPGLGGEVDNPRWRAQWLSKQVYNEAGEVSLTVTKNAATEGERANYEVDAISGATLTSDGVDNMIQFWLGEQGFKSYLKNIQNGAGA